MSKKLKHSLYLFITLIVLNIVTQGFYNRIDLTTDNRYTLAKVTKVLY